MKASVVVVSNKDLGLDLTINGLLGQVKFSGYEPRQVFDQKQNRITIKKDVPTYKNMTPDDLELVFVDTSYGTGRRKDEVESAKRLSSGHETNRKMLPQFGFKYLHLCESSYWNAYIAGLKACTGYLVIFMPDLAYASPHFVEAHTKSHNEFYEEFVSVGPVIERTYQTTNLEGMDLLGALLDPYCTEFGEAFKETGPANPMDPLFRIRNASASLEHCLSILRNSQLVEIPSGYELNFLFRGATVKKIGGDNNISLCRLDSVHVAADPVVETEKVSEVDKKLKAAAKTISILRPVVNLFSHARSE